MLCNFAHPSIIAYLVPICKTYFEFLQFVYNLPFSSPLDRAIPKLGGVQLDQHGVLPQAFDAAPGDAVVLAPPKAQKATLPWDEEGGDTAVLGAQLDPRGVAQLAAVTEVDDLHAGQLGGGDMSHRKCLPFAHILAVCKSLFFRGLCPLNPHQTLFAKRVWTPKSFESIDKYYFFEVLKILKSTQLARVFPKFP
jgi:hypothetical protein